jgi:hypothetical protein
MSRLSLNGTVVTTFAEIEVALVAGDLERRILKDMPGGSGRVILLFGALWAVGCGAQTLVSM